MPLALDTPNETFAIRIAELIEAKGHTIGKYEDRDTGACCALGGLRIALFGGINIWITEDASRVRRYYELVDWLASKVIGDITPPEDPNGELIIGKWNDHTDAKKILAKLREIGGADVPAVPQA